MERSHKIMKDKLPLVATTVRKWSVSERTAPEDHGIFKIHTKTAISPRTGAPMRVKSISLNDFVIVLPLTEGGEVVMVQQYRHGIEGICLELPGGLIDSEDASPVFAAGRELREETGFEATGFVSLGSCFPQPAVMDNRCFFILAENARPTCEPQPDPGEDIEVVRLPLHEAPRLIQTGEISSGMIQLAFCMYFMRNGMVLPG
jgi:8-oxo-dGTP pyrophosphatase MutT (NUDIX family)